MMSRLLMMITLMLPCCRHYLIALLALLLRLAFFHDAFLYALRFRCLRRRFSPFSATADIISFRFSPLIDDAED